MEETPHGQAHQHRPRWHLVLAAASFLGILVFVASEAWSEATIALTWPRTEAVVVGARSLSNTRRGAPRELDLEYSLPGGQVARASVVVTLGDAFSARAHSTHVGQTVSVYIQRGSPEAIVLGDALKPWWLWVVMLAILAGCFSVAIFRGFRNRAQSPGT